MEISRPAYDTARDTDCGKAEDFTAPQVCRRAPACLHEEAAAEPANTSPLAAAHAPRLKIFEVFRALEGQRRPRDHTPSLELLAKAGKDPLHLPSTALDSALANREGRVEELRTPLNAFTAPAASSRQPL